MERPPPPPPPAVNRSNLSFGNSGLITVGCCGSGCAAEAWPTVHALHRCRRVIEV